jgi:hypothetical protein
VVAEALLHGEGGHVDDRSLRPFGGTEKHRVLGRRVSRRPGVRPRLEALEDRRLLAAFYWKLDPSRTQTIGGTSTYPGRNDAGHVTEIHWEKSKDHFLVDVLDTLTMNDLHFDVSITGIPTVIMPGRPVQIERAKSGSIPLPLIFPYYPVPSLLGVYRDPKHPGGLATNVLPHVPEGDQPDKPLVDYVWPPFVATPATNSPYTELVLNDTITTYHYVLTQGTPPPPALPTVHFLVPLLTAFVPSDPHKPGANGKGKKLDINVKVDAIPHSGTTPTKVQMELDKSKTTAQQGKDFKGPQTVTITIAPGQSIGLFTIELLGDQLKQPKQVDYKITKVTGGVLGGGSSSTEVKVVDPINGVHELAKIAVAQSLLGNTLKDYTRQEHSYKFAGKQDKWSQLLGYADKLQEGLSLSARVLYLISDGDRNFHDLFVKFHLDEMNQRDVIEHMLKEPTPNPQYFKKKPT